MRFLIITITAVGAYYLITRIQQNMGQQIRANAQANIARTRDEGGFINTRTGRDRIFGQGIRPDKQTL